MYMYMYACIYEGLLERVYAENTLSPDTHTHTHTHTHTPTHTHTHTHSLTDDSTETFWESRDEPRGRPRTLTVSFNKEYQVFAAAVHIDNQKDSGVREHVQKLGQCG